MPARRIFCLARNRRCAIASSLARKARATCAVVSPHTVRSVSATCTSAAKDGWQQVKISRSMSSSSALSAASHGADALSSDLVRQLLLLAAKRDVAADAIDRLVAPDIDQPCARIGRQAGGGPALQRHRERILQAHPRRDRNRRRGGSGSPAPCPPRREIFFRSRRASWGRTSDVIPGWSEGPDPRISRFRVRCFASPRNDGCAVNHRP